LKTFETERLILKLTTIADAEFIRILYNSPKWIEFIDRKLNTVKDAKTISKLKCYHKWKDWVMVYTIIRKSDAKKLALVAFTIEKV
jgi:hypothetical protein